VPGELRSRLPAARLYLCTDARLRRGRRRRRVVVVRAMTEADDPAAVAAALAARIRAAAP
jgi:hypothetical protein